MPTKKRTIVTVRFNKNFSMWDVRERNLLILAMETKAKAMRSARRYCRQIRVIGGLAQLRVYNLNGRIAFENTYGKDPKRSRG